MRRPVQSVFGAVRQLLLHLGVVLAAVAPPASAATFQLVGDGVSQNVHWVWSRYNPIQSCFNSQFFPCGAVFATNGEIPLTGYLDSPGFTCQVDKGKLEWTAGAEGPTGQLTAVALTHIQMGSPLSFRGCFDGQDGWVSVDARDVPLQFAAVPEVGDPPTLTLGIAVRSVGNVSMWSRIGSAIVTLQYMTTVRVNGVAVVGDTLYTQVVIPDSTILTWAVELPDGPANHVMIPDLPWNSEISISLWAYMRGETTGNATIEGLSDYGAGPALVAQVYAANAVSVEDRFTPDRLWLKAGPNPTAGPVRIQYSLPQASPMSLAIYDLAGGRVATLAARNEPAGRWTLSWDGKDDRGSRLAAGLYFIELQAGSNRTITKVALLGR